MLVGYDLPLASSSESRATFGPALVPFLARRTRDQLEEQKLHSASGDFSLVRDSADEIVAAVGFDLPRDSAGYAKLCGLLNAARIAGLDVEDRRNAGDTEFETASALVRRVRAREASVADPGQTVVELFEVYAVQALASKSKRPASIDQDRMVIERFAEFVGRQRSVGSIEYMDAKEFVDALANVPHGYRKRAAYRGLDVREAIEKGRRDGARNLSLVTQQRYISTVAPFFAWLETDRGGRLISTNPFAKLHKNIRRLKAGGSRPSFTAGQIALIIGSPLFTGFLKTGSEHLPGNQHADDWRFWVPLLCLFTGARIAEAAQLRVEDVFKVGNIWCVEFRSDERTGQNVKNDKARTVAIHSTLIALGFSDFAERQKTRASLDKNTRMFTEIILGRHGQYGDKPSRWWRDYLGAIGMKHGSDGLGSHAFRHTMADQLRAAGNLDAVFGPLILGHSAGGPAATPDYGSMTQGTVSRLSELIESVAFVPIERGRVVEGGTPVDFSTLIAQRNAQFSRSR